MADSLSQGRSAKRIKLAGCDSYGKIPKVFVDGENNIVKMIFNIHDFPNLPQKRDEHLYTGIIKAHGYLWKLLIYPRGHTESKTDVENVSIFLYYDSETDPVVAKAVVRTKTLNMEFPKYEFSKGEKNNYSRGWKNFATREDIIENECNEAGTLTITVELQVATEKRSVWYPHLTFCDYTRLYKSVETSDVTVMAGTKEFPLHKCVLADRARVLYELVRTEEESSSSSEKNNTNNCIVVLTDVDEIVFGVLIRFVYSGEEPKLDDLDEETMKSILVAANRLGVTELKLYVESLLVDKFLVPSKAAALLLFADAHICALLKETSMDAYLTDPQAVIASHIDWTTLQESNKLLTELLLYASAATGGRKRYSTYVRTVDSKGDNILEDFDDLDVTSLRERLQQEAKLEVDGSRSMLVERWKDYLMNT